MVKSKASKRSQKSNRSNASQCADEIVQCPHIHFKSDVIDRNVLSKEQHLNLLSTPKGYRWEESSDKKEDGQGEGTESPPTHLPRKVVCSGRRMKKPEKVYVHNFLAEVWTFLTPEMIDRLKGMLMNEFGMSPQEADQLVNEQRESNIIKSSTVSLYKKPRKLKDGTVIYDSVVKMRSPTKSYCDKYPKSSIGIRNSWIRNFSDMLSEKISSYVLETMCADRTERQQEIAQTLLSRFNTVLEQKASMTNPRTKTHKAMVLAADKLSLWLDKNVKVSKETAQRLKELEEEYEKKRLNEERKKREEEKRRLEAERKKASEERKLAEQKKREEEEAEKRKAEEEAERKRAEEEAEKRRLEEEAERKGVEEGAEGKGDEDEAERKRAEEEAEKKRLEEEGQPPTTEEQPSPEQPPVSEDEWAKQPKELGETGEEEKKEEPQPETEEGAKPETEEGAKPETEEGTKPEEVVEPAEGEQKVEQPGEEKPPETADGPTDEVPPESTEEKPPESTEEKPPESTEEKPPESTEEKPPEPTEEPQPTTEEEKPPEPEETVEPPKEGETPGEEGEKAEVPPETTEPPATDEVEKPPEEPTAEDESEKPPAESEQPEEPAETPAPSDDEGKAPESEDETKTEELPGEVAVVQPEEGQPKEEGEPVATSLKEIIESLASIITEMEPKKPGEVDAGVTSVKSTSRQEAIKDVVEKELEKALGDSHKDIIDEVASKVGMWIDQTVDKAEEEYGEQPTTGAPVSQRGKGPIFKLHKRDNAFDVELISNTKAEQRIREARGKQTALPKTVDTNAPLESADLKEWAKWASDVTDMAQNWADWIENTVQEAQKKGDEYKKVDDVDKQKDWQQFKDKKSSDAVEWRRTKKQVDLQAEAWIKKTEHDKLTSLKTTKD